MGHYNNNGKPTTTNNCNVRTIYLMHGEKNMYIKVEESETCFFCDG